MDYTKETIDQITTALTELDNTYEALYREAKRIQQDFWDSYWAGNKRGEWKDRSILGVRTRRKKNGSFYIIWFYNKWTRTNSGKSIPLSQHIRQSKNGGYTDNALLKHAQDWEADVVLDVEARLAPIREAAKEIRAMQRKLKRQLAKLAPDDSEVEDDEGGSNDPASQ